MPDCSADIIIVGAGISGLYAAYTIHKMSPSTSVLILEQCPKRHMGGRAGTELFYGKEVATGAGVGRKGKDKLLYALLKELGLETHEYIAKPYYTGFRHIDIRPVIQYLREEYSRENRPTQTFKQFATRVLGKAGYTNFVLSSGHTDFENEDVGETLYYYGLEDNICCWKAFTVPWRELVLKLYESIGGDQTVMFSKKVVSMDTSCASRIRSSTSASVSSSSSSTSCSRYILTTESGNTYSCNNVIIASTIDGVRNILKLPIYKDIEGQPFSRIYAKFSKSSTRVLKEKIHGFTFLPHPLQKIIPMDPDAGIYMIAYNDNASALALRDHLENTNENKRLYESMLEQILDIPRGTLHIVGIRSYYWNIGTHYYKPLNTQLYRSRKEFLEKAQRPFEGILVVGEAFSRNQGWTEGALESVKEVVNKRNLCLA